MPQIGAKAALEGREMADRAGGDADHPGTRVAAACRGDRRRRRVPPPRQVGQHNPRLGQRLGASSRRGATNMSSNPFRRAPRRWRPILRYWRRRAGRTARSAATSPRSSGSIASTGWFNRLRATSAWSLPIGSRASAARRACDRAARAAARETAANDLVSHFEDGISEFRFILDGEGRQDGTLARGLIPR